MFYVIRAHNEMKKPYLLLFALAAMALVIPPSILDVLFQFNFVISILVLLAAFFYNRQRYLIFFPTVIFMATLLRLALNLASTRFVLLDGHSGIDAAGQVIQTFAYGVVGRHLTLGLCLFVVFN